MPPGASSTHVPLVLNRRNFNWLTQRISGVIEQPAPRWWWVCFMNVMVYGWASMAGMGTAIWLMARLCRVTLRFPLLLVAGGAFWNVGVLIGVGAILLGDSTGFQWLEFPRYVAVILFVAYTLMCFGRTFVRSVI